MRNSFRSCMIGLMAGLILTGGAVTVLAQEISEGQKESIQDTVAAGVAHLPENLQNMAAQQVSTVRNILDTVIEYCVKYSFQAIGGVIVLILGWIAAGYAGNFIRHIFEKQGMDVTVTKFTIGGVKILILVFASMAALGKFGIEIAPLIAGISVIGFGTSFALQGPLSNFAAGITLIFTKPFKVGDVVEVAGEVGEVQDIKLPRTELTAVDGHTIVIPNNKIIGEVIHNYSEWKRLDLSVGVGYKADVDKAMALIREVLDADERVSTAKTAQIGIDEFGDSSVNILVRLWCCQKDYWLTKFDLNKKIFAAFNAQGIEIPFPQRDVHIFQES